MIGGFIREKNAVISDVSSCYCTYQEVLVLSQVNRQLALYLGTTPLSPFIIDDGQGLYLTKGRLNAVPQT